MEMILPDWLRAVFHDGSPDYREPARPSLHDNVTLRLRLPQDAPVTAVYLRTAPDGEQFYVPMVESTAAPRRWFETILPLMEPIVHYRFLLQATDGLWFYNAAGPTAKLPLDQFDFRILADFDGPEWVQSTVFYQIFPDRFANGDVENDPQPRDFTFAGTHTPLTVPWGTPPPENMPFHTLFYGGDLPGITQRLDYLADLGVNGIYLNPIFTSHSNHRYDVVDYEQIDPHLGGNGALADLRAALDEHGMRILLDHVPNHCGVDHAWFQAARADADAPEAEFFTFHAHPDAYATWMGVPSLPKLNYRSARLRELMYRAPDASFRRWLQPPYRADGWRVDVANMLGRQRESQLGAEVIGEIRTAVKATNPAAYLLGEHFFDGSSQLQGDQWDATMNYSGFTTPLLYWLTGFRTQMLTMTPGFIAGDTPFPTAALAATWQEYLAAIPWQIALQQFNLLGSHDTSRIRSVVGENEALHRLAVTALFTFPGAPCIYYGDEVGLVDDPQLRQRGCMPWDPQQWDLNLYAFYQAWIRLRRETAVLQQGGFQILAVEADTVAYQRMLNGEHLLVIAHRAAEPRPAAPLPVAHGGLADGMQLRQLFGEATLTVRDGAVALPDHAQGASVWWLVG